MERWEYQHQWVANPFGPKGAGEDLAPSVMQAVNKFGAEGWEVCSVLEYWEEKPGGWWLVLLKRRLEAPAAG